MDRAGILCALNSMLVHSTSSLSGDQDKTATHAVPSSDSLRTKTWIHGHTYVPSLGSRAKNWPVFFPPKK